MDIDKKALRRTIRALKREVTPEQRERESRLVFSTIESLRAFNDAKRILLYYSLPDELPTHDVVARWTKTKQVFLPRVNGDELDILPFDGQLSTSEQFGIGEPDGGSPIDPSTLDLVIVPAVALDKHCNRMGRGKGYYDRLLPRCPQAYVIGVAMDCQLVDTLPVEGHDVPMCGVVTASHLSFHKAYHPKNARP